jgi:hypothetical protein
MDEIGSDGTAVVLRYGVLELDVDGTGTVVTVVLEDRVLELETPGLDIGIVVEAEVNVVLRTADVKESVEDVEELEPGIDVDDSKVVVTAGREELTVVVVVVENKLVVTS